MLRIAVGRGIADLSLFGRRVSVCASPVIIDPSGFIIVYKDPKGPNGGRIGYVSDHKEGEQELSISGSPACPQAGQSGREFGRSADGGDRKGARTPHDFVAHESRRPECGRRTAFAHSIFPDPFVSVPPGPSHNGAALAIFSERAIRQAGRPAEAAGDRLRILHVYNTCPADCAIRREPP